MLPLKTDVPSRSTPFVSVSLIVVNVLAFLYQASLQWSDDIQTTLAAEAFVLEFGAVPCRVSGLCAAPDSFPHPLVTVLTSMFLHGGLLHVGGNMLYLWIFGDNVEDSLGHARFLVLYLASGALAAIAQVAVAPTSSLPMIGASGAVSGVLGAYLLLFPHASVLTLVTFVFFVRVVRIPAIIVLGLWIVIQLLNGLGAFRASFPPTTGGSGVAWFAHIGGFMAGLALLLIMRRWGRARL